MNNMVENKEISNFCNWMKEQEKSQATIEKYKHDIVEFILWNGDEEISKNTLIDWKRYIVNQGIEPSTANTKIAAINCYLSYMGKDEYRVKPLKIQRKIFRGEEKELTKQEYYRLLHAAKEMGQYQMALVMETICSTGIRVSELKYITVEAAKRGQANINMKGKVRTILLPTSLRKELTIYAQKEGITSGELFVSKRGNSLNRRQIWAKMKEICKAADISDKKVFPHNLRHLFAICYYSICKDVAKLADVLGHSSIETTRIYLITMGSEHMKILDDMKLVQ